MTDTETHANEFHGGIYVNLLVDPERAALAKKYFH
jgi:hypothetical protein